jgi:hypothetical protein
MGKVSFVEFYLRFPERLHSLHPESQKMFWEQRHWHPVVRMRWAAEIQSNGEGRIAYPDGTHGYYTLTQRNGK